MWGDACQDHLLPPPVQTRNIRWGTVTQSCLECYPPLPPSRPLQFESEYFKARPPRFSSESSKREILSIQEIVYILSGGIGSQSSSWKEYR